MANVPLKNKLSDGETATLFNDMADVYDDLSDLWYSWLFSQLHKFILDFVEKHSREGLAKCLDVGCGTGLQTILFSMCGLAVDGIDISEKLLDIAQKKDLYEYITARDLFQTPYAFAREACLHARERSRLLRGTKGPGAIRYHMARAQDMPFISASFDIVNCCGSTLNFIEDYKAVITESHRCVRPGGYMILEVDNKYNLDLVWPIIDNLGFGVLGYDQTWKECLSNLFSCRDDHLKLDFPFTCRGSEMIMKMWLFSYNKLHSELIEAGFDIIDIKSIHSATNLIPSTILDGTQPSRLMKSLFGVLARLDDVMCSLPPTNILGCSTVYFCMKKGEKYL